MTDVLEEAKQIRCLQCDRLIADVKKLYDSRLVICLPCHKRMVGI
jgi:hypothetical protein